MKKILSLTFFLVLAFSIVFSLSACDRTNCKHEETTTKIVDISESTCTEYGLYNEVTYCTTCDRELACVTKDKKLKDHILGEIVVENKKDATCTEDGSFDNVRYCTVCANVVDRENKSIPTTGHKWIPATDETPKTCSVCGETEGTVLYYSKGLEFELSDYGNYYIVTGIGTCEDNNVVIPSEYKGQPVKSIADNAFNNCLKIASITIPDSVISIGDGAFQHCHSMTAVTIGNGVENIGLLAFNQCSSLTNVIIPDNVKSIGDGAFQNCYNIVTVTIENGVNSIGSSAFSNCSSLASVVIPDSVINMGESVFVGCEKLASVTIGNGLTSIGNNTFSDCHSLVSIVMPDSITSIGEYAFYYCFKLTRVTISNNVTSIGNSAFGGCTSLTIYCEFESQPDGWDADWNSSDCPVIWG